MLYLNPITEADATAEIQNVYQEIKSVLEVNSVPYYFQILANFPDLLALLWTRISPIVSSEQFAPLINEKIHQTSIKFQAKFFSQLSTVKGISSITDEETQELYDLLTVNLKMSLISIFIREAIKGLDIKKQVLIAEGHLHIGTLADHYSRQINTILPTFNLPEDKLQQLLKTAKPIFESIQKSQDYLHLRLELERELHQAIVNFPEQFSISYNEVIKTIFNKPSAPEVIYLIHDVFPGNLPHQFLFSITLFLMAQVQNQSGLAKDDQPLLK